MKKVIVMSKSNNEVLIEYLDKESLPYKIVESGTIKFIEIDLSKYTEEQKNSLYKEIDE